MTLISTNYLWMRILAFLFNISISCVIGFTVGIFGGTEHVMFLVAIIVSAFLGSFNILEPKVVEQQLEIIRRLYGGK